MKAIRLKTEYLTEPLGIDIVNPRFYWNCEGGTTQKAHQIIVLREGAAIWDSGRVESGSMTHIRYAGQSLRSRDLVLWRVRLWDENDIAGDWSESHFEMGLLNPDDWTAKWITGNYRAKKGSRYPVDCFRKSFAARGQITKARLYATACGLYDVVINGRRVEDFILAPGMTDYRKRIQYQTYDVIHLLSAQNNLQFQLADGWYRGSSAAYGVINVYGAETRLMAQLEIRYADGSFESIVTDQSFDWSNDGPIRFADLKDGEICDASFKPAYNRKAKETIVKVLPSASNNVPVLEREHFNPVLLTTPSGANVLDFGQNIAGYLQFSVQGEKGQRVELTCGETLNDAGELDLSFIQETRPVQGWNNLRLIRKLMGKPLKGESEPTPKQKILFLCSGGQDSYKTSFAIFGFRYVQIDTQVHFQPENFKAFAVYSAMEETSAFDCSNNMVNQLYQNTLWSMKGNFLDLPTDCPTRERLGWTGDAQIFFNTGAFLMDTAAFFRKWLRDMADNQYKNGLVSAVIPYQGVEMMYKSTGTSVGWADALYLIPYRYYLRFGDLDLLKAAYPMMRQYAEYILQNTGLSNKKEAKANPYNQYTYEKGMHLGEWLEPVEFRDKVYGVSARRPEECTAYFYHTMACMAEIARLTGAEEDAARYARNADGARKAYDALFVQTGQLETNRQAKIVRPLALGLLEGEDVKRAQAHLVRAVEDYHCRVGTGFLSTPFILPELIRAGRADIAYKVLENTGKPGWLAEVKEGATTIWESWEGNASRNHYSPGAVCEWLFDTVGGIRVDGENHFTIRPVPGGTLTYAKTSYNSIYGKVESSWQRAGDHVIFSIVVPANTAAVVVLPGGEKFAAGSGKYEFSSRNIKSN